jgi:hypothetical protein
MSADIRVSIGAEGEKCGECALFCPFSEEPPETYRLPACLAAQSRAASLLAVLEVVREYLEWGAMTGSDRDLFEAKFRAAIAAYDALVTP